MPPKDSTAKREESRAPTPPWLATVLALEGYGLKPDEFQVYLALLMRAKEGRVGITVAELTQVVPLSEGRIARILKFLTAAGLLRHLENGYALAPKEEWTSRKHLPELRQRVYTNPNERKGLKTHPHYYEEEIKRLREAGVGERYLEVDWEDLEMVPPFPQIRQAAERIHELVQSGENFAFLGPPGSGKTQALVLLAKAAVRAGISTRIYNVGRLALRVVSSARRGSPEFTEEDAVMLLVQPQLLLLDDLGGSDDYRAVERRILYHALEERAQKGLVVGFSSTLSAGDPKMRELAAHLGERSLERLKPLRVILFRHGRNFRDRKVVSVWD